MTQLLTLLIAEGHALASSQDHEWRKPEYITSIIKKCSIPEYVEGETEIQEEEDKEEEKKKKKTKGKV